MTAYGRRDVSETRSNQRVAFRLPRRFQVPVVGVSHRPDYPRSVHLLADLVRTVQLAQEGNDRRSLMRRDALRVVDVALAEGAVPVELNREPDNDVDPLAVAVWVPLLECGSIGFVPAATHGQIGHRLAEDLDAGGLWEGHVSRVRIHDEHPENPGIDIVIRRADKEGTT